MVSPLIELAGEISRQAETISSYIDEKNYPQLSFQRDGPQIFPVPQEESPHVNVARLALIEAAKRIYDLALGPRDMLMWTALTYKHECAVLRALNGLKIPQAVPVAGEASFKDISQKTGLSVDFVTRVIRFATTSRIFAEVRPGIVVHTAASLVLSHDKLLQANISQNLDIAFPAAARLSDAVDNGFYNSEEPNKTAFNLAFNTSLNLWEYFALPENEERRLRFHFAMESHTKGWNYSVQHLIEKSVNWAELLDGLVVDVGGSNGHVTQALGEHYKNLSFIIQDLPEVVAKQKVPEGFDNRIKYMAYNFMQTQPITADVYLLRWILHDWPDKYCITILKNIVPAMKPSSRIVLMDIILPFASLEPTVQEKLQRGLDLGLMMMHNARERSRADWEALVNQVDNRLYIANVSTPKETAMSVMEIALKT